MATTITAAFQKLKDNLEVTGLQKNIISKRQQNVRDVVAKKMHVLDSFLTGSYIRSTLMAPLSEADIDIFIVLDPKYYKVNGQTVLLEQVKGALLETYTKTPKISKNGQTVAASLSLLPNPT